MSMHRSRSASTFALYGGAIGLIATLALVGCSRRREATVGIAGNPLVVLLSPAHAPAKSLEPLRLIEENLRARTGLTIEVRVASSPVDAIEQFGGDIADIGALPAGLSTRDMNAPEIKKPLKP